MTQEGRCNIPILATGNDLLSGASNQARPQKSELLAIWKSHYLTLIGYPTGELGCESVRHRYRTQRQSLVNIAELGSESHEVLLTLRLLGSVKKRVPPD